MKITTGSLKNAFLGITLITAAACNEVDVTDGRVPAEYLDVAMRYAGDYAGKMGDQEGVLHLTFEGDRPVLTFTDSEGNPKDLIDARCESRLGNLQRFRGKDENQRLSWVEFGFDPNECATMEGRKIYFKVGKLGQRLKAEILDHSEYVPGRVHCHHRPSREIDCDNDPGYWIEYYVVGQFQKL